MQLSRRPSVARLRRVERAYTASQLRVAFRAFMLASAITLFALWIHDLSNIRWIIVGGLLVSTTSLAWCGAGWRRGVYAGLVAGIPPLLAPALVFALSRHHCAACEAVAWPCLVACFGTSSLMGIGIGYRALHDRAPRQFGIAAIATAGLTGLLGCGLSGAGGAIGVALGMLGGAAVAWCVSEQRQRTAI